MSYILLFGFCVVFVELFSLFALSRQIVAIGSRAREALHVLAAVELTDADKEAFARRASLALAVATGTFTLKLAGIVVVLYLLYLSITAMFPALEETFRESLVSPVTITVLTAATIAYTWIRNGVIKHL